MMCVSNKNGRKRIKYISMYQRKFISIDCDGEGEGDGAVAISIEDATSNNNNYVTRIVYKKLLAVIVCSVLRGFLLVYVYHALL
jgi:hypothetical protein